MGQTAQRYLVFETAGGYCGIAWNNVGVTRFQLPARSAEATERNLLRRLPRAEPGAPTPEVAGAIAAAKRYFEGEKIDFSDVRLALDEQEDFFKQIYAAAQRISWGHTTTYGPGEGSGRGPWRRAMSVKPWPESMHADHPLPQGLGGRRQGRGLFSAGRRDGEDPHA